VVNVRDSRGSGDAVSKRVVNPERRGNREYNECKGGNDTQNRDWVRRWEWKRRGSDRAINARSKQGLGGREKDKEVWVNVAVDNDTG